MLGTSCRTWIAGLCLAVTGIAAEPQEPALTRPEMKERIEALRTRTPRLPLPAPTDEERASGRSLVNNGRMRARYLPPSWQSFVIAGWGGGNRSRTATPAETLQRLQSTPDYGFKTRLFWIVSRANDCQYCLGHQELKLRRVGMTDDQIAALDSRWEALLPAERPAVELALKLTNAPQRIEPADLAKLQPHYKSGEIIDIVYTIARYNAVNRWTAATGIPQDQSFGGEEHAPLNTPTSAEFASAPSRVAPRNLPVRPEWEEWDAVLQAWETARTRSPVVELPTAESAARILAVETPGTMPPQWLRAIADLPVALDAWRQRQGLVRDGKTPPALRAAIAWVTARENRAWYAAAHARARYVALGGAEGDLASFTALTEQAKLPGQAEALRFARKLTSRPHEITDDDVARLREHLDEFEVAEIIQLTADANAFDRYTEALRLTLEF